MTKLEFPLKSHFGDYRISSCRASRKSHKYSSPSLAFMALLKSSGPSWPNNPFRSSSRSSSVRSPTRPVSSSAGFATVCGARHLTLRSLPAALPRRLAAHAQAALASGLRPATAPPSSSSAGGTGGGGDEAAAGEGGNG